MGQLLSVLWSFVFPSREFKVLLVGLDNAGKTTTLYQLQLGEVVQTQPTVGSNVETVRYKGMELEVWDLGGQAMMRPSWVTYYKATDAVIMVVDSTDRGRMQVTKEEVAKLLGSDDLRGAVLLVFANKQDLKDAMTAEELTNVLGLHGIKTHDWHIEACSAKTGQGLMQGLGWVAEKIKKKGAPPPPEALAPSTGASWGGGAPAGAT